MPNAEDGGRFNFCILDKKRRISKYVGGMGRRIGGGDRDRLQGLWKMMNERWGLFPTALRTEKAHTHYAVEWIGEEKDATAWKCEAKVEGTYAHSPLFFEMAQERGSRALLNSKLKGDGGRMYGFLVGKREVEGRGGGR